VEDEHQLPREVWSEKVPHTGFPALIAQRQRMDIQQRQFLVGPGGGIVAQEPNHHDPFTRFSYETMGHLIILPVGYRIFGIDPVNHRLLWEHNLLREAGGAVSTAALGHLTLVPDPRDGSVAATYSSGGWMQRLGQVCSFQGRTICIQTPKALSALDPLTGRILWSRTDVHPRNYLFADEDYVFVVELDNDNRPNVTRVFRATDGIRVQAPDFAALFDKRLQVLGRYLLLSESGATNSVMVRLYDIITGQDVWKQKYPARSLVARSEDVGLTGIVEPNGKVHVIDLRARKEVMAGEMYNPSERLKNVQAFYLLSDPNCYYFASQTTAEKGGIPMGVLNVMTERGMRVVSLSGYLHAFDRKSGSLIWDYLSDEPQYLMLEQFEDLPVLFLTARVFDSPNRALGGALPPGAIVRGRMINGLMEVKVTALHKSTGKRIFDKELGAQPTHIFGVRMDPRANTIELLSQQWKIILYPKSDREKETKSVVETPVGQNTPSPASRPAFERARIRDVVLPLAPN